MDQQAIQKFIRTALECSIYLAPLKTGLTVKEIYEIGNRISLKDGEIGDALQKTVTTYWGSDLIKPDDTSMHMMMLPYAMEEPEYRSFEAMDLVIEQLKELARSVGGAGAKISRIVLVERGTQRGLDRLTMDAAITVMVIAKRLVENDGVLKFASPGDSGQLPSENRKQAASIHRMHSQKSEIRERVYDLTKDVISRRSDGRPIHTEPLSIFYNQLEILGYKQFRMWWMQMVSELKRSDEQVSPVSVSVLSAALVEGALTFTVNHARKIGIGLFESRDWAEHPHKWKIDDLVRSAAGGGAEAILDQAARSRAEGLMRTRQRIHAGRMLADHPAGVVDLRPEEAREAKATLDLVVRKISDWIEKHPHP